MRGYVVSVSVARDDGGTVLVTGTYYPGHPGRVTGPPEHCYPPDPDEYEVASSTDEAGNRIDLSDDEYDRAFASAALMGPPTREDDGPPDRDDDFDYDQAAEAYERSMLRERD